MAMRDQNLGEYKPVAHANEVDLGMSDTKDGVNIRQGSELSEQFAIDERGETHPVHQLGQLDRILERINRLWAWECAAIFASLTALALTIWLLLYLDGTKLRLWKPRVKPNALLAIFMTIAKSCILLAIAACIAQLKWLYYGSAPRSLDEIDLFDNAGRGPWGATRFLATIDASQGIAKLVASVGAVLTVLALAMDPFAQQLLSYEVRYNQQPALSNQTWVPATLSHDNGVSLFNSVALRKALYGGLLDFPNPVAHACGSGNCTWDPFVSFGVNSRCQDVAASVNQSCLAGAGVLHENCTQLVYYIPSHNLSMVLQNGSAVGTPDRQRHTFTKGVTSGLHPLTLRSPVHFRFAVAQLLIDIDDATSVTNLTQLQNPSWNITACSIEWCAKVYSNVQVANSTFNETPPEIVDIVPSQSGVCSVDTTHDCQDFEAADKSRLPKAMANTVFSLTASGTPITTVRDLLNFDYNVTAQANSSALNALEAYNMAATLFWKTDIAAIASRVVTSYTNHLRSSENTFYVHGTAWADETYVEVRWPWLALPAALILVAAAFLIIVIVMSKSRGEESEPLWKTSTLPLLLHGVGWSNRREFSRAESGVTISAASRGAKAHLRRNHRGEAMFIKAS